MLASDIHRSPTHMTHPTYELSQKFYFEAAHSLHREVDAESSRRIHGHTYHAEVALAGAPAQGSGMITDLGTLRREIERVRDALDHRLLDDVEGIGPATLENLSQAQLVLDFQIP